MPSNGPSPFFPRGLSQVLEGLMDNFYPAVAMRSHFGGVHPGLAGAFGTLAPEGVRPQGGVPWPRAQSAVLCGELSQLNRPRTSRPDKNHKHLNSHTHHLHPSTRPPNPRPGNELGNPGGCLTSAESNRILSGLTIVHCSGLAEKSCAFPSGLDVGCRLFLRPAYSLHPRQNRSPYRLGTPLSNTT